MNNQAVEFRFTVPLREGPWSRTDAIEYVLENLDEHPYDPRKMAAALVTTPDQSDRQLFVPVKTSIAALFRMTAAQRERLLQISTNYNAQLVTCYCDDYATDNLIFALYKTMEPSIASHLISGLIEPDGRSHT